jgi:hypothetical protein
MLKIVKMMSLYFLAATLCEQTATSLPPNMLLNDNIVHHVMVSAYANTPQCTGSKRGMTSSAMKIRPEHYGKVIALSRDIAKDYRFGDHFNLWVKGRVHEVTFQDRMPGKHHGRVDLLLPSVQSCRQFGRNAGVLVPRDKA